MKNKVRRHQWRAFIATLLLCCATSHARIRPERHSPSISQPPADMTAVASLVVNERNRVLQDESSFVPLGCNSGLIAATCQQWSSKFGTQTTFSDRLIVECGTCVEMDLVVSTLTLEQGMDIRGKLVFPDHGGQELIIYTPMLAIQGELHMTATKTVDGAPSIRVVMTGTDTQMFTPIGENVLKCGGDCVVDKKSITVAGGMLAIQGLPDDTPTWLKLYDVIPTTDNAQNASSIIVDESVWGKWGPGADILITSHTPNWDADQPRTIAGVYRDYSQSGFVRLELNAPIYRPTTVLDSADFAVEVALLSRNIRWEADQDQDNLKRLQGGHFWIMQTPAVKQSVVGIEVRQFGQQGNLGRYPIHIHMCGDISGSVIAKNSVRMSHQRCFVVHATNNVLVEENIAYDTAGHCFIVEDGIESGNQFIRNLGARTAAPDKIIPDMGTNGSESDGRPATFWMTNLGNTWNGNVGAGSVASGFWFEPDKRGPWAGLFPDLEPEGVPLISFHGNIAHSNEAGITTYPRRSLNPTDPSVMNSFSSLKIYRNREVGILSKDLHNLIIENSLFADMVKGLDIHRADNVVVRGNTFIGISDVYQRQQFEQPDLMPNLCGSYVMGLQIPTNGFQYDVRGVSIDGNTFRNFADPSCSETYPISIDRINQKYGLFESYTAFERNTFDEGTSRFIDFCLADELIHMADLDGSLSPLTRRTTKPSTLLANNDLLTHFVNWSNCTQVKDFCYVYCEDTCFHSVQFRTLPGASDDLMLNVCRRSNASDCVVFSPLGDEAGSDWNNRRLISVHLPAGQFDAVFINSNWENVWPLGVTAEYQQTEMCSGVFQDDDVQLVVPPVDPVADCSELLVNGNAEESQKVAIGWVSDVVDVFVARGVGVNGSTAIAYPNGGRGARVGQFIDSRCASLMIGQTYWVSAKVKVEDNNGGLVRCDQQCPEVLYQTNTTIAVIAAASPQVDSEGYQTIEGQVTIDEDMAQAENELFIFFRSYDGATLYVDNASVYLINYQGSSTNGGDRRHVRRGI